MAEILIIDDEPLVHISLLENIKKLGHNLNPAYSITQGLELLNRKSIDLVFLDVMLPDGNGLSRLPEILNSPPSPQVIIITSGGNEEGATEAVKNGAWTYIEKPFCPEKIELLINNTMEYRTSKQKLCKKTCFKTESIIGKSNALKKSIKQAAISSKNSANIMIYGETGTGKELFAGEIHKNSSFNKGEYVVVDCATLPYNLAESILFGHEKGAFTGAEKPCQGLIKKADKGTLFLDEIGELPLSIQKKFLRFLQEKKFRPVGSTTEVTSDFRLISATNRNLNQMVKENKFRKDLLHRIKTITIELPPLRKRKVDIKILAGYFTEILCKKHSLSTKNLAPETIELLENYDWPGNVRELINSIEEAILIEPELSIIYPMFLPDNIRIKYYSGKNPEPENRKDKERYSPEYIDSLFSSMESKGEILQLKEFRQRVVEKAESIYLKRLLTKNQWNLDKTTKISGISKSRLYSLAKKYRLRKK